MQKCFLDMDGVLVDLHRQVMEEFKIELPPSPRPVSWTWVSDLLGEDVWKKLSAEFWAELPWTEEGLRILELAELRFGEHVCILSNPSESHEAVMGKMLWINRNIPAYKKRCLFSAAKSFLAGDGKLLVDDGDHNIAEFIAHGGTGLLVPRPWNALHDRNAMDHVEDWLQ